MNSELETCLTKAIYAFKVRDMLTRFGIPEDTKVTLELQLGEDPKPLALCEVPTTVKKDHVPCGSISMMSFRNLVVDDLINPAIHTLDLGSFIPDVDGAVASGASKVKVVFRSNTPDFNLDLVTILACCWPGCDWCCRFC